MPKSILDSNILLSNLTAQNIVLYIQNLLSKDIELQPRQLAILKLGADYTLSSIREFNVQTVCDLAKIETKSMSYKVSSDIHEELYYFESEIRYLFDNYCEKQDQIWQDEHNKMLIELVGA